MSDEDIKKLYKEALTEWLDKKFASFGKWTIRALLAAALAGLVYISLWVQFSNCPLPKLMQGGSCLK